MIRRLAGLGLALATTTTLFMPVGAAHADPVEEVLHVLLSQPCPPPTRPYLVIYVYGNEAVKVCK